MRDMRKMTVKFIFGLLAMSAGVSYAEKPSAPFAAARAARTEFERTNGSVFRDAHLVASETLDDAQRLDSPGATGAWSAVLPYSDDERVRFLEVTLKDGKFTSGTLLTFGDKAPVPIDAKKFDALREEFPMIAVKREAALYPAKKLGTAADKSRAESFGDNAVARVLGPLGSATDSLGLRTEGLAYRVSFVGADGLQTDLGIHKASASRFHECALKKSDVVRRLTEALEAAYPERKGRISERQLVDYWKGGKIVWKGVAE